MRTRLSVWMVAAALLAATAPAARAEDARLELGASLATLSSRVDRGGGTIFEVPGGTIGLMYPGLYASVFVNDHVAVEPQLGLLVTSGSGYTSHLLHVAGQVDYFLQGVERRSPYLFASAGVIDSSGSAHPKTVSAGAGYRVLVGDRLAFRFGMRYQHTSDDNGNYLLFSASIGGLLGKR